MSARSIASRVVILWLAAAAVVYTVYSIDTILRFAPHALYADQWRQYVDYVTLPFPQNVLHPDNGHRLFLPNLIAWLEIQWFDGNQWLQIICGVACALGAASLAAWACVSDREVPAVRCAAAAFLAFFAIFWLANVRTLFHSDELLHTTIPMACLMLALTACLRATRAGSSFVPIAAALFLALLATFSFGYGMSVFVGILAALVAGKAEKRQFYAWLAGLCTSAALYLGLPDAAGVTHWMVFSPLENLLTAMRWLGAPFVVLFTYLWDPGASGLLPTDTLRQAANAIATIAARHLPDLHLSVMPYALFGGLGMFALFAATWRRVRATAAAGAMETIGLGIAWFALGAAGIVSISRLSYFHQFPDQIYANRYLPWPCLFWLGLGLVGLSKSSGRRIGIAHTTLAAVALLPLVAWPMQFGGRIYADLVRGHIDNTATGSLVGVYERGMSLGETTEQEYVPDIPVLRPLRIAQFGDPIAALLGQTLPATARFLPSATLETKTIADNLLGDPGTGVVMRLPATNQAQPYRALLVDTRDVIVGYVVRDARVQPPGYSGYAQGVHAQSDLRVVEAP
jgi:hypothetical protein